MSLYREFDKFLTYCPGPLPRLQSTFILHDIVQNVDEILAQLHLKQRG
jgi:hypothetical protein